MTLPIVIEGIANDDKIYTFQNLKKNEALLKEQIDDFIHKWNKWRMIDTDTTFPCLKMIEEWDFWRSTIDISKI